jgi:hypothetical protein
LCIFFFYFLLAAYPTKNKKQLNPNDLLVAAASPYGLIGYHNGSSPTETAAVEPSASRTGLLSTVTDTTSSPSSANAVHQPVNRLGNLDWLIHSLNTNLPDPAALIRQPNLTPNLKHMIQGGGNNNNNNSTATTTNTSSVHQRSPQHVAHQGKSPLNNRHHSFSSSLPARANFVPVTGMASNSTNTNNKFPKSSVSPAF